MSPDRMPALHEAGVTIGAAALNVSLGRHAVLHDLTLDVGPGWAAIVGPNGAGKSTLLRALAGLVPTSGGRVLLQGRDLREHTPRDRGRLIAWMAQHGPVGGDLTVHELVRLGRLPHIGLFGAMAALDEDAVGRAMSATG
jgi:iron complex transport system ATP-binding protein